MICGNSEDNRDQNRFQDSFQGEAQPTRAKVGTWTFLTLPDAASAKLPSRGMTSIAGTINGHAFRATLEPDGKKSHWLKVTPEIARGRGCAGGRRRYAGDRGHGEIIGTEDAGRLAESARIRPESACGVV